jgi:hypothetical protein
MPSSQSPASPSRSELIHLFWDANGMRRFANNAAPILRIDAIETVPFNWRGTTTSAFSPSYRTIDYEMMEITLCGLSYAYIRSHGHMIVEPFEWQGFEFLSAFPRPR